MRDDKRLLREIKREVKRAGNRKLRRYLKDPAHEADDFDYGRFSSRVMNNKPTDLQNHPQGGRVTNTAEETPASH